jgi:hypothetical protein
MPGLHCRSTRMVLCGVTYNSQLKDDVDVNSPRLRMDYYLEFTDVHLQHFLLSWGRRLLF